MGSSCYLTQAKKITNADTHALLNYLSEDTIHCILKYLHTLIDCNVARKM